MKPIADAYALFECLTQEEQIFVEFYVRAPRPNAVAAVQAAGYGGSFGYQFGLADKLLSRPDIRFIIDHFLSNDPSILSKPELLRFYTNVVRGKIRETRFDPEGIPYRHVSVDTRLKAAAEMGKLLETFNPKTDINPFEFLPPEELIRLSGVEQN